MYLVAIFVCLMHLIYAAPLERIMVDLTHVFNEDVQNFPMWKKFEMTVAHNGTFGDNLWVQAEEIRTATHMGTHMDAPSHFVLGGINIDQIPVSRFIAPAAVINIAARAAENSQAEVAVEDLVSWEQTTGQSLDGTIVLFYSGWDKKWHNRTEFIGTDDEEVSNMRHPGVSRASAQWLVDNRDIKGIGMDTISFDVGGSHDFPAHTIFLGKGLFGLENVANIDKIPIYGATLYVMPMKIGRASGAPTRVVASFPKVIYQH